MGESYTISISSSLVNRLNSDGDKVKKSKKPRSRPADMSHITHAQSSQKKMPGLPSSMPLQLSSPFVLPPSAPQISELDAIRSVIQDSEAVLDKLQKKEIELSRKVLEKAKELHENQCKLPPAKCSAEKTACLHCYKENEKNPLACAAAVRKFADCAQKARLKGLVVDQ